MVSVFADTSYFVALVNPRDSDHDRAVRLLDSYNGLVVTTTWVLSEVAAYLSYPAARPLCVQLFDQIAREPMMEVIAANQTQFESGLHLFTDRLDKSWSLVDCISFNLMHARGITDALSADHHFEQAGFKALLRG